MVQAPGVNDVKHFSSLLLSTFFASHANIKLTRKNLLGTNTLAF